MNPDAEILEVSATTGANLDDWYAWLEKKRDGCAQQLSTLVVS